MFKKKNRTKTDMNRRGLTQTGHGLYKDLGLA